MRRPVSQDPPAREPLLQADGQPRIKVPGLADQVWADTVVRTASERILADFDADFRVLADS